VELIKPSLLPLCQSSHSAATIVCSSEAHDQMRPSSAHESNRSDSAMHSAARQANKLEFDSINRDLICQLPSPARNQFFCVARHGWLCKVPRIVHVFVSQFCFVARNPPRSKHHRRLRRRASSSEFLLSRSARLGSARRVSLLFVVLVAESRRQQKAKDSLG
jgi:hypothetical protein